MQNDNVKLEELFSSLSNSEILKNKGWLTTYTNGMLKVYGPKRSFWFPKRDHLATISQSHKQVPNIKWEASSSLPHRIALHCAIADMKNVNF